MNDLALRAQLSLLELEKLAHANALATQAGHRCEALWQGVAGAADKGLLREASITESRVQLDAPWATAGG